MRKSLANRVEAAGYTILDNGDILGLKGQKLKPWYQSSGYLVVNICYGNGKKETTLVHRLVASKFCECSDKKANDVNHIDGNKSNNYVDNLEWLTRRQNRNHYVGHEDYMTRTKEDAVEANRQRCRIRSKANKVKRDRSHKRNWEAQ